MTLFLLALGAILLALPGIRTRASKRGVTPAHRARTAAASLAIGSAALLAGLLLLAAPTIMEAVKPSALAHSCALLMDRLSPGGQIVGWMAAVLAALIGIGALRAGLRGRRQVRAASIEPWLGSHIDRGPFELVVVPTSRPVAVGVPGRRPQVVVSEGLVDALTPGELEAVIRHEAAHLRLGHARHLRLAAVVDGVLGWVPVVRRSTTELRKAVEQWADDAAAGEAGDTVDLRHAIVSVATAKAAHDVPTACAPTAVLARAERLRAAPRRPRRTLVALTYAPVVMAGVIAVSLVGAWLTETHHALALSNYCPS